MTDTPHAFICVASANHVAAGRAQGFMQLCHGKAAPLRRLRPGDFIAYYSPSEELRGPTPCRTFTALGRALPREPYRHEMAPDFVPWRRDVAWYATHPAPIAPLLPRMSWSAGDRHWGYRLRFGIFEIPLADMALIGEAMGVLACDLPIL